MKRKMLPKKDAPNGLYLYCTKHKRWYKNDNVVKCKCELKYKAKIHIPNTINKSVIKTFEADNVEHAIQIFQTFKLEMKQNNYQKVTIKPKEQKPILLLDCIAEFFDFKNDIDVPFHNRNNLDRKTIKDYECSLDYFIYALVLKGINTEILKFEDLDNNELIAGYVSEFLIEYKGLKPKSFNNRMSMIKSCVNYIKRKYYPNLRSPFDEIKPKKVVYKPKSISIENFNLLIDSVFPENGIEYKKYMGKVKKGRKERVKKINYFRPWLIDAFCIGLFTGGRLEETTQMKWSDIQYDNKGRISHIKIVDLKVNRIKKIDLEKDELIEKYVEMTPEFEKFLYELGYEEKKGRNEFILANEELMTRKQMANFISIAFSHYYKQLGLNDGLTFKNLRKTFVTTKFIENDVKTNIETGHAGMAVVLKHYVDMKMVMEAKRNRNFGEE